MDSPELPTTPEGHAIFVLAVRAAAESCDGGIVTKEALRQAMQDERGVMDPGRFHAALTINHVKQYLHEEKGFLSELGIEFRGRYGLGDWRVRRAPQPDEE